MLNESITINGLELHNRLVMPPMATERSGDGGRVTQAQLDYYGEKARGGYIGLIITEHSFISPEGRASAGQLSIAEDAAVQGLRRLTDIIHQNGSKVIAQINHAGGKARPADASAELLAPSAVPIPRAAAGAKLPRGMTEADIERVIRAFTAAARRAKEAGYDGVEIHSAHGYLLNQFYSPLTNKRADAYGGGLEGRIRLHLEVIRAVRAEVGADYPVALRLGACDYAEGGATIEDSALAAAEFERAGIDLLDISGGHCGYVNPNSAEQGYFSEISEKIKERVHIPVILTGGITQAEAAERLLRDGKVDLIGVGRAILRDSDWARRAIERGETK